MSQNMGIDYETYIIFGWYIDYSNVLQYMKDHNLDEPYDIVLEQSDDQPQFDLHRTSPWYDCDDDECLWYFGIRLGESQSIEELKQLVAIPEAPWYPNLLAMVNDLGEDGNAELYSILHVS